MTTVSLKENSDVQPGWIYVRKFKEFYPPKNDVKFTVGAQPIEVRVEKIMKTKEKNYLLKNLKKDFPLDKIFNNEFGKYNVFLTCYLHQIETAYSCERDFEYVSEVAYCSPFYIAIIIKAPAHFNVQKNFKISLNQCYHNMEMMNISEIEKHCAIYIPGKNKIYRNAENVIRDIIDSLKVEQLVPDEAKVTRLNVRARNKSEEMCLDKPYEKKGIFNSFYNKISSSFHWLFQEDKKFDSAKRNRQVHDRCSTSNKGFIMHEKKELKLSKQDILHNESDESYADNKYYQNTMPIQNIHPGTHFTQSVHNNQPGTQCTVPVHSNQPGTDLMYFNEVYNTCNDKPYDYKINDINGKQNLKAKNDTENETKIVKSENETKLVETKNDVLQRNVGKSTDQPIVHNESIPIHKKRSNYNSSNVPTPTQARKVVLYEPFKEVSLYGIKEKIYGNENIIDGKPETKTLLLFGEIGSGKSSLINFVGDTFVGNGNSSKKNVIDTSENTYVITFYTFKSFDANRADLTIIDTPGLSSLNLKNLIKFLSSEEVNVVIHSLGFVVNSHSQGLTAYEKKLLDYIRSAYGEVSNNHLITFMTFSDVTQTRPVIEDLKRYGVKPTCILEFNLIPVKDKTLDDFDKTFLKKNFKKWKTGLKAINQMDPISIKSMKLAQEATYIKTFCEASVVNLKNEIMSLLSAEGTNCKEISQNVWVLGRLAFAMQEETDYSDAKLIQFLATLFAEVCKIENSKKSSLIFTFLLMVNSDNPLTTSVIPVLNFYNDVFLRFPAFLKNKETPISVSTLSNKDEVTVFCKHCKDIHCGLRVLEEQDNPFHFVIRCRNCSCHGNAHELWTQKDSYDLIQELSLVVNNSLQLIVKDLSALGLSLEISLPEFMDVIVSIYPVYSDLIRVLQN